MTVLGEGGGGTYFRGGAYFLDSLASVEIKALTFERALTFETLRYIHFVAKASTTTITSKKCSQLQLLQLLPVDRKCRSDATDDSYCFKNVANYLQFRYNNICCL